MKKSFWNDRYKRTESSYGTEPNKFFQEWLSKMKPGVLLLPGEGEGRNALFAASIHWRVSAIDFSDVAKSKALESAKLKKLNIDYQIGDLGSIVLPISHYDAIALIYVHLSESERKHLHRESIKALKKGGRIILEAFSKEQMNHSSGGPKQLDLLYSSAEMQEDFKELKLEILEEKKVLLNEGSFHDGLASVVRLVGEKL